MENIANKKKADAIISDTLVGILDSLNENDIRREDVINVFYNGKKYIAVFYAVME